MPPSRSLFLLVLALSPFCLASCGNGAESSSVQCGPGTREVDGRCVGAACGAGTHEQAGVCVPDADGSAGAGGSPEGGTGGTGAVAGSAGFPGGAGGKDAGDEGTGGSAGLPGAGDPCPKDGQGNNLLGQKCSADQFYQCWGDTVAVVDCAALGGECKPNPNIPSYGRCEGGPFVACDGSKEYQHCADDAHILLCDQGWWMPVPCSEVGDTQDNVCMKAPLSDSSYCVPNGTQTCDPAAFPTVCSADGKAIVRCSEGLVTESPCKLAGKDQCVAGPTEPVCVQQGSVPCDPATNHGNCVGVGMIEVCEATTHYTALRSCQGTETCHVSALGWAACVPPGAEECDPATSKTHCADKATMHLCGNNGFEHVVDCAQADPSWYCIESTGNVSCGAAQSCEPSTYVANCTGSVAVNCHPFGYVVQEDCSMTSWPPQCSVENGKAVCK